MATRRGLGPATSKTGRAGRRRWNVATCPAASIGIAAEGRAQGSARCRPQVHFRPPVPRNQVLVGLANGTDWAKEIWSENVCSGRLGSVYQDGPNLTPRRMLLNMPTCREGTDTIVFRKPGFWGIWHDVGHFPPELFWQAFGGTVADFTWVTD